jgi:hypothetical protein
MKQSRLSSIIEIGKGTLVTLAITGIAEYFLPIIPAFTVSLVASTYIKYLIRRCYNSKGTQEND